MQEIQDSVTSELDKVTEIKFGECFLDLKSRWKKCIDSGGDYFEGCNV